MKDKIQKLRDIIHDPPGHENVVIRNAHASMEDEEYQNEDTGNEEASAEPPLHCIEELRTDKLLVRTARTYYYVLGTISQDFSSLRTTLMIEDIITSKKERIKIELYEREPVHAYAAHLAASFQRDTAGIEEELMILTDLLERHREMQADRTRPGYKKERSHAMISPSDQKQAIEFLSGNTLMSRVDHLLELAGIAGESKVRRLLFTAASSYKMQKPLHVLVQGMPGKGKKYLTGIISQCIPPEDVLSITRISGKSLYHYNNDELIDKLIVLFDHDKMNADAREALSELQSEGKLSSLTTFKDKKGNIGTSVKYVRASFASLSVSNSIENNDDIAGPVIITGMDESIEQAQRIIAHHNRKLAGLGDEQEEEKAKRFLQNCIRCLKKLPVVNPFAEKISFSSNLHGALRLNSCFHAFAGQVALLHQY